MTDMRKFLSNYLDKTNFPRPRVLTIESTQQEEVGKPPEKKWVLYFQQESKGLVLGTKLNLEFLIGFLGHDEPIEFRHIRIKEL